MARGQRDPVLGRQSRVRVAGVDGEWLERPRVLFAARVDRVVVLLLEAGTAGAGCGGSKDHRREAARTAAARGEDVAAGVCAGDGGADGDAVGRSPLSVGARVAAAFLRGRIAGLPTKSRCSSNCSAVTFRYSASCSRWSPIRRGRIILQCAPTAREDGQFAVAPSKWPIASSTAGVSTSASIPTMSPPRTASTEPFRSGLRPTLMRPCFRKSRGLGQRPS